MLLDTHAHLLDEQFDEDRAKIIEELRLFSIAGYIECGTDVGTSVRACGLAGEYAEVWAAVGVHPHSASEWKSEDERILSDLAKEKRVVAIGEIGLDYHYDFSPKEAQKEVFRLQMDLAAKLHLPVIIHSREASADTMDILEAYPDVTGVLHCFSGSVETMERALALGYYIGFGGAITFKNAKRPLEACGACPENRLLLETDSPYMTPVPYRGKRNTPFNVRLVAEKAAEIRKKDVEELADAATKNAATLFGLELPATL